MKWTITQQLPVMDKIVGSLSLTKEIDSVFVFYYWVINYF